MPLADQNPSATGPAVSRQKDATMKPLFASVVLATCLVSTAELAASAERPAALDDICPANADPCLVTKHWDISNLPFDVDFGLRTVRVSGSGAFDANGEIDTGVNCGRFEAMPGTLSPVYLAGPQQIDSTPGGRMTIRAYRSCSDDPDIRCLSDADCTAGACSVGDGSIILRGQVLGNAAEHARLTLSAAGPIEVHGGVQLSGKDPAVEDFTDGGELIVSSTTGPVLFDANLNARAQQYAGSLAITTGGDVVINSRMNLRATYFGGSVEIDAGGNVEIDGRIQAQAQDENGDSGHVTVHSGGTIVLGGTKLLVDLSGRDGEGGVFEATASQNVELGSETMLEMRQAELSAGADVLVGGRIDASSSRNGGSVDLVAARDATIEDRINVSGNRGNGGQISVSAGRTLTIADQLKTKGQNLAGTISLAAPAIVVSGSISSKGASGSDVLLTACDISLLDFADIDVDIPAGGLHTISSSQLTVAAGAHVIGPADGDHVFEYRDGGPVPTVLGDVEPSPTLLPAALAPCP